MIGCLTGSFGCGRSGRFGIVTFLFLLSGLVTAVVRLSLPVHAGQGRSICVEGSSVVVCCFRFLLALASLFRRDTRCFSAHARQRVWPGMAGLEHFTQRPLAIVSSLLSCAYCRWYSMRSGDLFLARSYSRRVSFALTSSLGAVSGSSQLLLSLLGGVVLLDVGVVFLLTALVATPFGVFAAA